MIFLASLGCGSAIPDARPLMSATHDPSPLAKCHIAANASSPLVTEWPASEKSHLETLVLGQAIAVEYSGCELRLVDACRLPGKYAWQRTTLSTDTVEINDADELYAKLPLGALSLEGELKRSGRLAVRTTVSGQMKLVESDLHDVPREGPCARASHVITAISIGAFKLLGGGGTHARGSASFAGVGGGGGSADREEQIVREAGDPKVCSDSTAEAVNPGCSSPLQIFLAPIERKKTEDELRAEKVERDAQAGGGVRITFAPPDDGRPWSLRAADDQVICKLPCTHWVPPKSGSYIRREDARTSGFTTFDVPSSFDVGAGASLDARVKPGRGSRVGAIAGMVGSTGVLAGGLALAFANNRHVCFSETHSTIDSSSCYLPYSHDAGLQRPLWIGLTVAALGVLGLGASFWWFRWSEGERLELAPTVNGASTTGRHVWVGPAGATGAF
jgi:hypothetical protein